MFGPEILLVVLAWGIAGGTPGPATLAISGTAMGAGRGAGVSVALGIVAGSACWGTAAALGMSAVMVANAWMFEVIRYAGAAYLLYLALKSLKSALNPKPLVVKPQSKERLFLKGFLIHLTNPKAILAWGSIYAIALPKGSGTAEIWQLFGMLITMSTFVFVGYGILFALPAVSKRYAAMKRWFDGAFAALFGAASLKILTARLEM